MSDRILQKIFLAHSDYLDNTPQPLKNRKAIYAIQHCRTEEMGESFYSCKSHHELISVKHSCRHRSCYLCAQKKRREWIESQKKRLFNTAHFHVVFTLPHEYLTLWRFNEALFTSLIFKASRDTLMELMSDPKHHGVTPGILMALHTWGRKLDLHPHTHCLITAGGIDGNGNWKSIDDFLLPVRVLKSLYRGKLQGLLKEARTRGELTLPDDMDDAAFSLLHRAAYRKTWCVHVEDRYDHGQGVMIYLARYLKGGAIHPKQIIHADARSVVFTYKDYRTQRIQVLSLQKEEFLKRVLTHVPAIGKHTVRFYGLYSTASKVRRERCAKILGVLDEESATSAIKSLDSFPFCKSCGCPTYLRYRQWRGGRKGNSINRESSVGVRGIGFVQQGDEAVRSQLGFPDTS